jgi:hypothetical protein
VDKVDEPPEEIRIGVRQYAVTEIEDVARSTARTAQDITRPLLRRAPPGKEPCRIQIALDPARESHALPGDVQLLPGVDANDVAAGVGHQLEKGGGLRSEVDGRRPSRFTEDACHVPLDVLAIVGRGERPHP